MLAYDEMELAFFMLKFQVINLVYILVPRTEENIFKTKFKLKLEANRLFFIEIIGKIPRSFTARN